MINSHFIVKTSQCSTFHQWSNTHRLPSYCYPLFPATISTLKIVTWGVVKWILLLPKFFVFLQSQSVSPHKIRRLFCVPDLKWNPQTLSPSSWRWLMDWGPWMQCVSPGVPQTLGRKHCQWEALAWDMSEEIRKKEPLIQHQVGQ